MNSLNIKKGDNVLVLAGKDKGKTGEVLAVNPKNDTVLVSGVNIITKHNKPRSAQDKGGRVQTEGKLHVSNVQAICNSCKKATRIGHTMVDGKKVRVCKKCGANFVADKYSKKTSAKKAPAKKAAAKADKK